MDLNSINSAIMFGNYTNDQLNSIVDAVKYARAQLTKDKKREFSVGAAVKFRNSRTGGITYGTVKKINIKYILVDEKRPNSIFTSVWRVPANMLEAA